MNEPPLSEQIGRARTGHLDAAEVVVRRAGRLALPLAVGVLGDRDEAADVAQDVAVEVLRGLGGLRDPERFDAWVRRIAVRHALRAARRRRGRFGAEVPLETHEPLAPAESDPHDRAHVLDLQEALHSALAVLPARQRLALVLRYVDGLTDSEIGDVLGCRPGTAASLLSRGRELLRRDGSLVELVTPISGGCR